MLIKITVETPVSLNEKQKDLLRQFAELEKEQNSPRKRTFFDVIFVGDATVTVPAQNSGFSTLIGVPFRVQIPLGESLSAHVSDTAD